MSPTDASRFTDAATFWHPTGHPTPHTGLRSHVRPGPPCQRRRPGNKTQPPGDRSLRHDWARRGVLTPIRSTTPATTLGGGRPPLSGDPHSHAPVMRPMTNDSRALSTVMTATLSADLQGRVPADLVADVVRAVLDESRHAPRDRGVEPTMLEARRRLEWLSWRRHPVFRARASRPSRPVARRHAPSATTSRLRSVGIGGRVRPRQGPRDGVFCAGGGARSGRDPDQGRRVVAGRSHGDR